VKTRWFTAASAAVAGFVSLIYTLVYISRWEWGRAQLTADLTLLCAVGVLGLVLDARLRNLRTDRPSDEPKAPAAEPQAPLQAPPRAPSRDFRWLATDPERYGVFIPVLLGAGMVASGLAWILERLSGAVAKQTTKPEDTELPDTLLVPATTPLWEVLPGNRAEALLRGPGAGS
jgi:hypothetical protein